jgi:hypothetical protein
MYRHNTKPYNSQTSDSVTTSCPLQTSEPLYLTELATKIIPPKVTLLLSLIPPVTATRGSTKIWKRITSTYPKRGLIRLTDICETQNILRLRSYRIQWIVQGDQKVSVHLMITIQKVTSNVQSIPRQSTGPGGH